MDKIDKIIANQRKYFETQETKKIEYRIKMLKELKRAIQEKETEICEALKKDLGKCETESYMTEVGMVLDDLGYIIKHTKKWAKKEYHMTPLAQFPSTSYKIAEPYGLTLIISPWNYPFLLTMQPLIGAICAGNCAIIKTSEYSPNTSKAMQNLIKEVFEENYVTVILGDKDVCQELLQNRFDYIFYTGGTTVGKIVMQSASKYLTPVTLELGGKSPCIVEKNSNIDLAARRIIFGKMLNCGQTCVAPDYVLVQKEVKEKFVQACQKYIIKFINNWKENPEYPKMINEKHFDRVVNLINPKEVIYGGHFDKNTLKIEPTLLEIKDKNSLVVEKEYNENDLKLSNKEPVMQEEIFGPILPILEYDNIENAITYINSNEKPLALYLFTDSKKIEKKILKEVPFGGGCINDTIIHLASSKLGFGGVGNSGMGEYHGKYSFQTFSHYKSILKKSTLLDLPMRYHPYKKINDKLIRMFMR